MEPNFPRRLSWMFNDYSIRRNLGLDPEAIPGWPDQSVEVEPYLGVWLEDGRASMELVDDDGTRIAELPVEWVNNHQCLVYRETVDRLLDFNA